MQLGDANKKRARVARAKRASAMDLSSARGIVIFTDVDESDGAHSNAITGATTELGNIEEMEMNIVSR